MAFTDIIQSGTMQMDRTDTNFLGIASPNTSIYFPLVTGGGGGLAVRVIGSPIIKTIKVGR